MNLKTILLSASLLLMSVVMQAQESVIELDGQQSMCITGKGQGQDAAINPYIGSKSIAVIQNFGKNPFSIRVQKQGQILSTQEIAPGLKQKVILEAGQELYFDGDRKTTADVKFERFKPSKTKV